MDAAPVKRESPSAERNKDPIWGILQSKVFPNFGSQGGRNEGSKSEEGLVRILEIAAGAGVHTYHVALQLMKQQKKDKNIPVSFYFQPTDPDPVSLESLQAYVNELPSDSNSAKVARPLQLTLDKTGIRELSTRHKLSPSSDNDDKWWDIILNINMIHISPWSATLGLMKVAGTHLRRGGILYLYGPYRVNGTCVESNL